MLRIKSRVGWWRVAGILLLALAAVLPAAARAVKSQSLDYAEAKLAHAIKTNDPHGLMQAVQMARLAVDAPRDRTLFLEARATYALAWVYFLNDETRKSAEQARIAVGVLNRAVDMLEAPTHALQAYRVMMAALLQDLDGVADPMIGQLAEDDLRDLIEHGGDDPLVLYARAMVAVHESRFGQKKGRAIDVALTLFTRLAVQEPQNRTFRAFAIFLKARSDPEQRPAAAKALTDMLRQDPAFRPAVFLRGRLYSHSRKLCPMPASCP
jgi:hypothetical protein